MADWVPTSDAGQGLCIVLSIADVQSVGNPQVAKTEVQGQMRLETEWCA